MHSSTAGGSGITTSKTNISLPDAIQLATEMIKPLADVSKHIQDNISLAKDKRDEIAQLDPDDADLATLLTSRKAELVTRRFSNPQTVCGAIKCIGAIKLANGENIENYKQICHESCTIPGVSTGCKHQEELKICGVMTEDDEPICTSCPCSWAEHMHRNYITTTIENVVEDASVQEFLKTSNDKSEIVNVFNQSLRMKINILEDEQKAVTQVSAQLATFLEQNNTSAGSDVTAGYMDHLIDIQQTLVTLGNSRQLLESMMTTRNRYTEEVNALKQVTKADTARQALITTENILDAVETLCNLPETGDQIRSTLEVVTSMGLWKQPTNSVTKN